MSHVSRLHLILAALLVACLAAPCPARAFFSSPPEVVVVEYKNIDLGHYFLTANAAEMAAIDAGAAGAGWYRTGFGFSAFAYASSACQGCVDVVRFYGTPGLGPNSHFYTADPVEAAGLKSPGSGWTLEGFAFAIRVPDAAGQCAGTPVYRLYNNRWMFNDSNHRYVTDAGERARMIAAGWADEGVKFCSTGPREVELRSYAIQVPLDTRIMPSSQCEDESINLGSCLAVNNLPVPSWRIDYPDANLITMFERYTGVYDMKYYSPGLSPYPGDVVNNVFVQGGGYYLGLHIDTRTKGASVYSSVNPLYQFRTDSGAGGPDPRFFPWTGVSPFDTQLSITEGINWGKVTLRSPDSHAYGHPTLELIDQRSGHHLYFTVLAYGTVAEADYLARDVVTGKVIVGTTHRAGSSFGRNFGATTLHASSGLDAFATSSAPGGLFDFRVDRAEFQRILDAARTLDGALSADPTDYFVDNFHFNNEVVNDGEIGVNLSALKLRVLRR